MEGPRSHEHDDRRSPGAGGQGWQRPQSATPTGPSATAPEASSPDRSTRRSSRIAGLIGAVPAIILSLIFISSFIGALHNPHPRSAPVGIVGPPAAASSLGHALDHAVPGGYTVTSYPTMAAARNAINTRAIDAALVPGRHAQQLLVARAVSSALTDATIKVFTIR